MAAPRSLLKGFEKVVETVAADPTKRQIIYDEATTGLCLIVSPKGRKTLTLVARGPDGKQVWREVGKVGEITIPDAREKAREGIARIKQGLEPFPPPGPVVAPPKPRTFKQEAEAFLQRHVREKGLRSVREVERIFERILYPEWQDRAFISIRRADVAALLDKVQDDRGPVMADRTLARLSKLFNWYASRADDYVSPIIRGMARSDPATRARKRILNDDELQLIWKAAGESGSFGAFIKLLLLTGQRRAKVAGMRWNDIADSVWTIPAEAREKTNAGALKLPQVAVDILATITPVKDNPYVFAGRGKAAVAGFSPLKAALDAKAAKENSGRAIERWTLHDLRRTAKSLMARAGVRPDISERVLGHAIKGVEGVYDRHSYSDEKAMALEKLAGLIDLIAKPRENVVAISRVAS
jgi:integrase